MKLLDIRYIDLEIYMMYMEEELNDRATLLEDERIEYWLDEDGEVEFYLMTEYETEGETVSYRDTIIYYDFNKNTGNACNFFNVYFSKRDYNEIENMLMNLGKAYNR